MDYPILKVNNLIVKYQTPSKSFFKKEFLTAVDEVSLVVYKNKTTAIVGESGCGKTTLCNTILALLKPFSGNIEINNNIYDNKTNQKNKNKYRKNIQAVFQNPASSLNQRLEVWEIISEPLYINGVRKKSILKQKAMDMLVKVGLDKNDLNRYAFEFSGGQKQRIAIARALITNPDLIILDEPTSGLDRTVEVQIIKLLKELQQTYNLTYLYVTHNLKLAEIFSENIYVMYNGKIVESGITKEVFDKPQNDYTKKLFKSILTI